MPNGGRYGGGRSYSSPYSGSSGVYTASGARVYNPAAYAATGAKTYTSTGRPVSNPVAYAGAIEASVRQNTSAPKYLYHYTDSSSLNKISDSGRIKSSTGPGDCALGRGVCAYGMTRTLHPKRWQSGVTLGIQEPPPIKSHRPRVADMTAKPPRSSDSALLHNNYDGAASSVRSSKVQSYVRVDADKVNAFNGRDQLGRDVFVVPGDVHLAKSSAKLGHR